MNGSSPVGYKLWILHFSDILTGGLYDIETNNCVVDARLATIFTGSGITYPVS